MNQLVVNSYILNNRRVQHEIFVTAADFAQRRVQILIYTQLIPR